MLRTTDESPPAPLGQVPDHILDQAISWAVRIHAQPATEADRRALDDWRARSPMHEAAWQSVQSVDRQLGSIPDGAGPLACLTLENASRDRGISRRRMLRITGLAALATGTGLLMKRSPWWQEFTAATAIGVRRAIDLEDGSHLMLNSGTRITIAYHPLRRTIRLLRGDVYIETGDDTASIFGPREFWVESARARLEALGTRFCVRRETQCQRIRLHVADGAVATRFGDGRSIVRAGQNVWIEPSLGRLYRIERPDCDPTAWVRGAIVARRMSLIDFTAELNRYYGVAIKVSDQAARLYVSGVFQLDGLNAVARILNALAHTLPVHVRRTGESFELR